MILTKKQTIAIDFLEDKTTKEVGYGGAAGGGKSLLGCYWQLKQRIKYPGTRGLIGRSKLKTLKETTLRTFFEVAEMQGLKNGQHFKYNQQSSQINFSNGSDILLKDLFLYPSDPNFDELGSLEITDAYIDESAQVTKKAKDIVQSRIRYGLDKNDLIPKILWTSNPSKNWIYNYFYKPDRDNTLPEHRKFIRALPTENPHLPKSYLDSLLSLDENSKQRLYYGNWEYDDDPSTLIEIDAITDYFDASHVEAEGEKFMTIDVARKGKDNTVFRVWHGWKVIHRYAIDKSGLDVVVKKAKELQIKFNIPLSNVIADEDGVGGGVVDFLKCKGFVNGSTPLKEFIGTVYKTPNYNNLKSQCGFKMAEKIMRREVGEIAIDPRVAEITSQEMEQVKQKDIDKDGKIALVTKDVIKQNIGRSPDEWDSIMMRMFFYLKPKAVKPNMLPINKGVFG